MMKKIILCISIIFCAALYLGCGMNSEAADNYSWGHGFGMGYGAGCYEDRDYMMKDLSLTDDQANKIADIDDTYRKRYYKKQSDFDKIDSLRKEHQKAIDTVLNDNQKSKYDSTYNSRWRGWGKQYGRRHMGGFYGHCYGVGYGAGCYENRDYMLYNLGLTDDQGNKIANIDLKYRTLYFENRDNFNKIDELRKEHRNAIDSALTLEQRDKYASIYDNRWRGWGGRMGRNRGMMGY